MMKPLSFAKEAGDQTQNNHNNHVHDDI